MSDIKLDPETEIDLRYSLCTRLALGALFLVLLSHAYSGGPGIFLTVVGLGMLGLVGYQFVRIQHFKALKQRDDDEREAIMREWREEWK